MRRSRARRRRSPGRSNWSTRCAPRGSRSAWPPTRRRRSSTWHCASRGWTRTSPRWSPPTTSSPPSPRPTSTSRSAARWARRPSGPSRSRTRRPASPRRVRRACSSAASRRWRASRSPMRTCRRTRCAPARSGGPSACRSPRSATTLVTRWPAAAARLAGGRVVLEPLADEHAGELYLAARDPRIWEWLDPDASASPNAFAAWFGEAMEAARRGEEVPFAVRDARAGALVGSTRYLALAPEHRRLEVGWTWYAPAVWGTAVNAECKLLLLTHAFERLGCVRVEFKTD